MARFIDLTGQRFSKLFVESRSQRTNKGKNVYWVCICDCGQEKDILGTSLRSGKSKSCGCGMTITQFQNKHKMVGTRTYTSWASMKSRVLTPSSDKKKRIYGDLEICDRWVESFEEFMNDMGVAPTEKHTIDRIDNTKGYFPENCRWATQAEQNRNYSLNRNITFNGKTQCAMDWSKELGIPHYLIYQRLRKGWSTERIFGVKPQKPA
jgi:hypothetical protein